jgi:hypothetical protein
METPVREVLSEADWTARAASHAARVDAFITPHLARRSERVKHPVHDFLFTYYSFRPAQLRRWHPGYGVALAGGSGYAGLKGYSLIAETAAVSAGYTQSQRPLVTSLRGLLSATASRPPQLGCFGLHEWAMVYRSETARHAWPLRLGQAGTDEVVETHRITCSHFDAFRFFTPPARPLNVMRPASDDRAAFEQPGCLHAGMDLYKHAFRLSPMICSDLVADCFELARDIRVLDMRAAPYDLTGLATDSAGAPWTPIPIETPEGKTQYVALQREFSQRAVPLRQALIECCDRLLMARPGSGT